MAEFVKLNPVELVELHEQNERLMSYNVEFAEVTGGTFWKAYTPINLYDEKLRKLTKELGTAWCRVSGTWATKTYQDFDGEYADGTVPEGYLNVLTKEPWPPTEAEKLFGFSKAYGNLQMNLT